MRQIMFHIYPLRKISAYLALTLALALLLPQTVLAVDHEKALAAMETLKAGGSVDYTDPTIWYQGRVPDATGRMLAAGASGDTVAAGGCSYFAAAYMLYRMGELDIEGGETPMTVLDKMESIRGWLTWGKMDFKRISEVYPNVTCTAYKYPVTGMSEPQQIEFIRRKMLQGCFIILCVAGGQTGSHYIFVDSVTADGDMRIGDSAYEGTYWSTSHRPSGTRIVDVTAFRHATKTPANTESIYPQVKVREIKAGGMTGEQRFRCLTKGLRVRGRRPDDAALADLAEEEAAAEKDAFWKSVRRGIPMTDRMEALFRQFFDGMAARLRLSSLYGA